MKGFCLADTLQGHGIPVKSGEGEDLDSLYSRIRRAINEPGPQAVLNKRKMAPGVPVIEGTPKGHDVVSVAVAREYLEARGRTDALAFLADIHKPSDPAVYRGSAKEGGKIRDLFGKVVCEILGGMSEEERVDTVRVFDCDLEGSCGLHHIHKEFPEVYVPAGIMERGNSADAREGVESFLEKRDPVYPVQVSEGLPDIFPDYQEPSFY